MVKSSWPGLGLTGALALALAACGGDDGGNDDDDTAAADSGPDDDDDDDDDGNGSGDPDAATAEPLTCIDLAFCTTYSVNTFEGEVRTAAGGTVQDGVYRKAWEVVPPGESLSDNDLTLLAIRAGTFVQTGFFATRGTLTTDGTTLTMTHTSYCELGAEDGDLEDVRVDVLQYTSTSDQLVLFDPTFGSNGDFVREMVFIRIDELGEACDTVNEDPPTPGESARCRVGNCACVVASGEEIDSCTR